MHRTERFYKIELLLRGRGRVSFAALLDELEISPAPLKRDLQYLRDRLGAPIVYDSAVRGWATTAHRRAPSRHFELQGSALVRRQRVWLRYSSAAINHSTSARCHRNGS